MELGLVAAGSCDTNLGCSRRQRTFDARHAHFILANLLEANALDAGRHIRVVVQGTLDLVHQLRGNRADTHLATRAVLLLAEDGISGALNGRNRAAQVLAAVKEIFEAGVVAPRRIGRALDEVSCNQRSGQGIEVAGLPVVPPGSRSNSGRGVGHTAADDNVCPRTQGLGNSHGSQIAPIYLGVGQCVGACLVEEDLLRT